MPLPSTLSRSSKSPSPSAKPDFVAASITTSRRNITSSSSSSSTTAPTKNTSINNNCNRPPLSSVPPNTTTTATARRSAKNNPAPAKPTPKKSPPSAASASSAVKKPQKEEAAPLPPSLVATPAAVAAATPEQSLLDEFSQLADHLLQEHLLLIECFRARRAVHIDWQIATRPAALLGQYVDLIVAAAPPSAASSFLDQSHSSPSSSSLSSSRSLEAAFRFIEQQLVRCTARRKVSLIERWISVWRGVCLASFPVKNPLLAACVSRQLLRVSISNTLSSSSSSSDTTSFSLRDEDLVVTVLYWNNGLHSSSHSTGGGSASPKASLARRSISSSSSVSSPLLSASQQHHLQQETWKTDICSTFCNEAPATTSPLLKAARHFCGRLFSPAFVAQVEQRVAVRRSQQQQKQRQKQEQQKAVVEKDNEDDHHEASPAPFARSDTASPDQIKRECSFSPPPRCPFEAAVVNNNNNNDSGNDDDDDSENDSEREEEMDPPASSLQQTKNKSNTIINDADADDAETSSSSFRPWVICIAEAGSKELITAIESSLGYTLVGDVASTGRSRPKSRQDVALLVRNDRLARIVPGSVRDGTDEKPGAADDDDDGDVENDQKSSNKKIFNARFTAVDFHVEACRTVRVIGVHLHHRSAPKRPTDYPELRGLCGNKDKNNSGDGDDDDDQHQHAITTTTTICIGDFNRDPSTLFPSSDGFRCVVPTGRIDNCVVSHHQSSSSSQKQQQQQRQVCAVEEPVSCCEASTLHFAVTVAVL